jgi:hypothetical protein
MMKVTVGGVVIEMQDVDLASVNQQLLALRKLLTVSAKREVEMSQEMDQLQAAVTRNTTLDGSIMEIATGIATQLAAVAGDKAATLALAAELNAKSDQMAAWAAANTPAAPPA